MEMDLTQEEARRVIESLGGKGTPPEYGFQHFTAGLDKYMSVIEEEYLNSFILQGGSVFKMVVGAYGGGKTHFLYCIRDLAWKHGYVVSYVTLSPEASPFHKLELVYKSLVDGLVRPLKREELFSEHERGIAAFIKSWYSVKIKELKNEGLSEAEINTAIEACLEDLQGIESISFRNAIRAAIRALVQRQEMEFEEICQWLKFEGYEKHTHAKHGILQKIDRTTAFSMIRSLSQWLKSIGSKGFIVLMDEAERVPSLSTAQRETHLSNLREIIDECGGSSLKGVMLFYAIPDENFLQGKTQVYEALKQRLSSVLNLYNPTGVKIELNNVVSDSEAIPFLKEIGGKITKIYEVAYNKTLDAVACQQIIDKVADFAVARRFMDISYKREFVQKLITALNHFRYSGQIPTDEQLGA